MTFRLEIPEDLAKALVEHATQTHRDPEEIALGAIRKTLASDRPLSETEAPVQEVFNQSGMMEDEAVELFDAEQHTVECVDSKTGNLLTDEQLRAELQRGLDEISEGLAIPLDPADVKHRGRKRLEGSKKES